ncbi:hypothetical protein BC830DRAFT_1109214 [Chytriomyces sp. MP71]|nr:hypothetical protein BC830DRAFT_1109214 [Chytriomyces sp. MP71]
MYRPVPFGCRPLPIEVQLLIFGHVCSRIEASAHDIVHLVCSSEALFRAVAQSNIEQRRVKRTALRVLYANADASLGTQALETRFVVDAVNAHSQTLLQMITNQAEASANIILSVNWIRLLLVAHQNCLCARCFTVSDSQYDPVITFQISATASPESPDSRDSAPLNQLDNDRELITELTVFEAPQPSLEILLASATSHALSSTFKWERTFVLCPPCCYKPRRKTSSAAGGGLVRTLSSSSTAAPSTICMPELDHLNEKQGNCVLDAYSDTPPKSTTQIIDEWRTSVLSRRKQRAALRGFLMENRRRWTGGGNINGWTPLHDDLREGHLEDEDVELDSDSENDGQDPEEIEGEDPDPDSAPSPLTLPEFSIATHTSSIHAAPLSTTRTTISPLALTKTCPGCQTRFCTPCVRNTDPCPTCSAQLCIGCFPPPPSAGWHDLARAFRFFTLVTDDDAGGGGRREEGDENEGDDDAQKRGGRRVALRRGSGGGGSGGGGAVGRRLTCASCGAVACAGCGELEDWMLRVDGFGEDPTNPSGRQRRQGRGRGLEQSFLCVDCRSCRANANFDYGAWL